MPRRPRKIRLVDFHVARKMQAWRTLCGLSQAALAERIGITFQQLQKYETGANRISASRLWEVGRALGVPISYFYKGFGEKPDPADDVLSTRAGLELIRDFEACSGDVRKYALDMCKAMAKGSIRARGKKRKR